MGRSFVLLDTETTGTGIEDRICQLAFIVKTGKEVEYFCDFCKPPLPISFHAMAVNGITNEMVEDKPECINVDAFKKLEELNSEENVLLIQNAKFDIDMLEKEGFSSKMKLIDTYRCIRHLEPDLESHSLQYLRYALGFYKEEQSFADELGVEIKAHDALGDVVVLNFLMRYIVGKLEDKTNIIDKLVELTQQPILVKTFRFGKYKGQKLKDVAASDAGYLNWMLKNADLDVDLRFSIEDALS